MYGISRARFVGMTKRLRKDKRHTDRAGDVDIGSLPASIKHMLEKAFEMSEIVIDSFDLLYTENELDVIEPIMDLVVKDSALKSFSTWKS